MKKNFICIFLVILFLFSCLTIQSSSAPGTNIYTFEVCENLNIQGFMMQQEDMEQYNAQFHVMYDNETYSLDVHCQFIKFNTDNMFTYNKNIAHVSSSNYEILYFSLTQNNDILNSDIIVPQGKTLVQAVFVIKDIQKVLAAYTLLDTSAITLREENLLLQYIPTGLSDQDIESAAQSPLWFVPFYNNLENAGDCQDNAAVLSAHTLEHLNLQTTVSEPVIEEYAYSPNGSYTSINDNIMPAAIIDDDSAGVIDNIINQDELMFGGCSQGFKENSAGTRLTHGWKRCGYVRQPERVTTSAIAIWDLNYHITTISGNSNQRYIEFTITKAYNIFAEYRLNQNILKLTYAPVDSTYLTTGPVTIGVKIVGKGPAWLDRAKFEVNAGGSNAGTSLGEWGISQGAFLLGKRYPVISVVSEVYGIMEDTLSAISSTIYNHAQKEFEISPLSETYTKQVGSTYTKQLFKQYSKLKTRVRLTNWNSIARQKQQYIYYQVDFTVPTCIRTSSKETFSFYIEERIV